MFLIHVRRWGWRKIEFKARIHDWKIGEEMERVTACRDLENFLSSLSMCTSKECLSISCFPLPYFDSSNMIYDSLVLDFLVNLSDICISFTSQTICLSVKGIKRYKNRIYHADRHRIKMYSRTGNFCGKNRGMSSFDLGKEMWSRWKRKECQSVSHTYFSL